MLAAVAAGVTREGFTALGGLYQDLNSKEIDRESRKAVHAKAVAVAEAIERAAQAEFLDDLRKLVSQIELKPSSRSVVHALLKLGDLSDVRLVLD